MTEDGDNQSLSLNKQINKVTVSNPKTHLHQYFVIVIDGLWAEQHHSRLSRAIRGDYKK